MKITSLGHTECLMEFPLKNGDTWRLLLDSWLTDYSVADCMERAPQIKINWEVFPKIDVVYISHSHMDHLDPYFLTELYRHQSPLLLLAETLAYLIPTLKDFLPEFTKIEVLKHSKTRTFMEEIEITGILFVEDRISNEDDVMTLFVAHGDQSAFFEIDTVPPMIYEEQQKVVDLFLSKPYKSRVYVHSNNELEGNLKLFDCTTAKKRNAWIQEYITVRKEEILEEYATMMEHELPLTEIWNAPGFRAVFIGQGLQYPHKLSQALAGNKFFGLEEVTRMFKKIANTFKITHPFQALLGGNTLDVRTGGIAPANISGTSFVPGYPANTDHGELPFRAKHPLHQTEEIYDSQESKILLALNTRFLPTKIADMTDSLKQILVFDELSDYIIEVQYGNSVQFEKRYYAWGFQRLKFERICPLNGQNLPKIQEIYFANDLVDFLEGRLELYCNFIQTLDPKLNYRFWTVLGADFINHDLIEKKYRYHFEQAKARKTPEDYVMQLYQK